MKITKRQLKRIIREERNRLLNEGAEESERFQEIMEEMMQLVEEAHDLSGQDEGARRYWYNTIRGCISIEQSGVQATMIDMQQTLDGMAGGEYDEESLYDMGANGQEWPAEIDPEEWPEGYDAWQTGQAAMGPQ